jgi:branched-chain amino acid transport system permease protein
VLGALIEVLLLRRIYRARSCSSCWPPSRSCLVIKDARALVLGCRRAARPARAGPDRLGRDPGRQFPTYDLFLIVVGPVVLGLMWLLLTRTRWGTLVRAATQDREMVSALGVNQAWLFTAVFALGALLAGLGGALQLPREPANARDGPQHHRRRLRGGGGGRHGLAFRAPTWRPC